MSTCSVLRIFEGHTHGVTAVAFSDDASRILSWAGEHVEMQWDLKTGKRLKPIKRSKSAREKPRRYVMTSPWLTHSVSDKSYKLWLRADIRGVVWHSNASPQVLIASRHDRVVIIDFSTALSTKS
jgi:WD40 repeat protein